MKMQIGSKNEKAFVKVFYQLLIVFLIIAVLLFFFLSLSLNEKFFLKYSDDKKLEEATLEKIHNFQKILLGLEVLFLILIFLFILFKVPVKLFIGRHKTILQNLLLLVGVLLLIFVVLEGSLRVVFYDKTTSHAFGPTLKFNYKYVSLNKEGFRDKNYDIAKPENTIRIVGLGDSFAYAWGIKDFSNSYSKVLERKLNMERNENFEVINFGAGGKDTEHELNILKENALKYSPDIVVISYVPNDIRNVDANVKNYEWAEIKTPLNFWFRNFLYSYFFVEMYWNSFLDRFDFKDSYQEYMLNSFNSEVNRGYNKEIFKQIAEIAEKNNMKVLIVMFPIMYDFDNYAFLQIHNFVREESEKNGFYYMDMLSVYGKYNIEEIIVNKYDRHPNEFGHEIAANAIYGKLASGGLV